MPKGIRTEWDSNPRPSDYIESMDHYTTVLYQARNTPRGVEIVHWKCSIEMYPTTEGINDML